MFAAAVLGLVHDRVRDVGNLFRVIGDTAGGLAGGGIKAVGATVNVSSWSHSGESANCATRTCFWLPLGNVGKLWEHRCCFVFR